MKKIIKPHKNVTILYADIVNYTAMTTQITPASQFVQVLDDLFGGFDEDSEVSIIEASNTPLLTLSSFNCRSCT